MKNRISLGRTGLRLNLLLGLLWATAAGADGLIVIPRPPGPRPPDTPFPLEVRYHRVETDINDQRAVTRIDQVFYNPTGLRLEGFYLFPLPKGSVLNNFSMDVNGQMVSAELLDAKKAREIYEDIVRRARDPALLEYTGQGAFKVRIFPIEPKSEKRVKISYTEVLTSDRGMISYVYPLNTEKFSSRPLDEASIRVNLEASGRIKTILCPSHQVEIRRHGERHAVIGFEARKVKPDTDFVLYYDTDASPFGLNVLTHRSAREDGYFLLTASPAFEPAEKNIIPKDIVLVVDTSGSMAGKKLDQAKKALIYCLENLNSRDRFEIVRFSTEAEPLWQDLRPASAENIRQARKFVEDTKPIGGTNMEEALTRALEEFRGAGGRPGIIIFLTDGKPTIGETGEDQLLKKIQEANTSRTRIFTFGIGEEINTHLLDKITEETRAYRTYVRPDEEIEVKVSGFYEKIKSPVLADINLRFGGGVRASLMYPAQLPDLFQGTQLVVFGRYQGQGKISVNLEGTVEGARKTFSYQAQFPESNLDNDFIPGLWASQRIGYLLDQIRLHGEERELKEEIIELARRHGIVTPYTSYLIMEDEKARIADRRLSPVDATLGNMPATGLEKKVREEYRSMHDKSGSSSIQASKEVEGLKNAWNFAETRQGQDRLNYADAAGRVQNLGQQVRNIQGRAFYQNGNIWVDSKVQSLKVQNVKRLQFASPEYFSLLEKEPATGQFLALGKNVRFAAGDTIYEIYE